MNDSALTYKAGTLICPLRGHWVSFRLVDEHGDGKRYADLAYTLHDSQGQKYEGFLDGDGYAKVDGLYRGPSVLSFDAAYGGGDKWYEHFADRKAFKLPLTALQVASEQSPTHHRLVNHNDPVPGVPFTWMDAEWKLALPGTVALFSSPLLGIAMLLGGLLNLRGDPYEHHGEQRHFMPRKHNAGSEAAILWQPGCAVIDEQACATYAGAVDLENDMPKRKSLIVQALSAAEHSSDGGYSRSMLTTLLRWNASVESRNGALFTQEELRDIQTQVQQVEQQLANWQPGSFIEFRRQVRLRHDARFYDKSDMELRQLYQDGINLARKLGSEQREALGRARTRLLNQAQRQLASEDVFGDLSQRSDLAELVSEWRAIDANTQAEKLAKIPTTEMRAYA